MLEFNIIYVNIKVDVLLLLIDYLKDLYKKKIGMNKKC